MLLKWLLKGKTRDKVRSDMGGVQAGDKYYHCLSCDNVWPGPCPSPCKKCRSTNVVQCSEIVYINYVKKCMQDKKII